MQASITLFPVYWPSETPKASIYDMDGSFELSIKSDALNSPTFSIQAKTIADIRKFAEDIIAKCNAITGGA